MTRTILRDADARTRTAETTDDRRTSPSRRPGRAIGSLVAALGLVVGTLGAVLLMATPGTSGAATPTPVNTMYVLN